MKHRSCQTTYYQIVRNQTTLSLTINCTHILLINHEMILNQRLIVRIRQRNLVIHLECLEFLNVAVVQLIELLEVLLVWLGYYDIRNYFLNPMPPSQIIHLLLGWCLIPHQRNSVFVYLTFPIGTCFSSLYIKNIFNLIF